MSLPWTDKEQIILLDAIPAYRKKIENKELKEVKRITKEVAQNIHQQNSILHSRTVNSIYERLPYLENLLAGVFEISSYAIKDRNHYLNLPRHNQSKVPNICNIRHSYNGAMIEYLRNKNN